MAYRRSICSRATLLARRFNPCFSCISQDHEDNKQNQPARNQIDDVVAQTRSFGSYANNSWGPGYFSGQQRSIFPGYGNGMLFHRYMSTSIGEGSEKVEYLSDVAGVISDAPVEAIASQAPVVSEVAIAAADSAYPVAALQYVIDAVHSFTGFNWWASIALTTLLIRSVTVPFLINQLKATSKLTLMRPRLEEIKGEMEAKGMDPEAVADGKRRMNELFREFGVTPFTPLKGIFIQAPIFISFFFAISNMVEKVPSFKNGGAFWFTDLTTQDSMCILPVLTALTFLINVEFNVQEGLEGNPVAGTMKKFSRGLAVLTVPFTMNFPQAIFCYWVTSNIFSFAYGSVCLRSLGCFGLRWESWTWGVGWIACIIGVLKMPGVKKALGVPDIPVAPPTTNKQQNSQSGLSFFETLKRVSVASQNEAAAHVAAATKSAESKSSSSSSSSSSTVLSQRLRNLERQVKQKKKNKKR